MGSNPLKVVVGAGGADCLSYPDWLCLQERDLDITDPHRWAELFAPGSIDAILCEHVFEHLTPAEAMTAARNFYTYLRPGGYARIAVPDGLHPDWAYVDWVRPGGIWNPVDHKQLFDHRSLSQLLTGAGFGVRLLEWWDENGCFHSRPLDDGGGEIQRCLFGSQFFFLSIVTTARYTSLVIDAIKPLPGRGGCVVNGG
jgi:predicted SAM-dependent methyltransferase